MLIWVRESHQLYASRLQPSGSPPWLSAKINDILKRKHKLLSTKIKTDLIVDQRGGRWIGHIVYKEYFI